MKVLANVFLMAAAGAVVVSVAGDAQLRGGASDNHPDDVRLRILRNVGKDKEVGLSYCQAAGNDQKAQDLSDLLNAAGLNDYDSILELPETVEGLLQLVKDKLGDQSFDLAAASISPVGYKRCDLVSENPATKVGDCGPHPIPDSKCDKIAVTENGAQGPFAICVAHMQNTMGDETDICPSKAVVRDCVDKTLMQAYDRFFTLVYYNLWRSEVEPGVSFLKFIWGVDKMHFINRADAEKMCEEPKWISYQQTQVISPANKKGECACRDRTIALKNPGGDVTGGH